MSETLLVSTLAPIFAPTSIADVPFQAYVIHSRTNDILCGASVISSFAILTAASCLVGRNVPELTVVVGDRPRLKEGESEQRIHLANLQIHEGFYISKSRFNFNIAIGFLSSNLTFNRYVAPIKLNSAFKPIEGIATISGYRKPPRSIIDEDNFLITNTAIVSAAECAKKLNMAEIHSNHLICVTEGGSHACTDYGGALAGRVQVIPMLLGVATGSCEVNQNKPEIFINVAKYAPWINGMMHRRTKCDEGEFRCQNRNECIPSLFVCNGFDNCGNNEDEMNCVNSIPCKAGQFKCPGSSKCNRNTCVCDGDNDCDGTGDEVNCIEPKEDCQTTVKAQPRANQTNSSVSVHQNAWTGPLFVMVATIFETIRMSLNALGSTNKNFLGSIW